MTFPAPPLPPSRPKTFVQHGRTITDEHFGLRDATDAAVLAWLEEENGYAGKLLADTAELRAEMEAGMRARVAASDESTPAREGGWFYLSRVEPGREYPLLLRREGASDGPEEILLDLNELARGRDYTKLGGTAVSPDGRLLAYAIDHRGDEAHLLRVRDLAAGRDLPDEIANTCYGLAWSACGNYLFYTVLDGNGRSAEARVHRLGDDPARDATVHREEDAGLFVHVGKTEDGRYILIHAAGQVTSEVRAVPSASPLDPPRVIRPRVRGVECRVTHLDGFFYLLTNDGARDFRVDRVDASRPDGPPETVVPHEPGVTIEHMHALRASLVLHLRERGRPAIRLVDPRDRSARTVRFDAPACAISPGENRDFAAGFWRFAFETPAAPPATIDLDISTLKQTVRKVDPVPGFDPARYRVERHLVAARDGARVPLTLLLPAALPAGEPAPVFLHGYGAYGVVEEDEFRAERFALVDRGWIYAVAHPRGGGEMGRDWYEAGKGGRKENTFRDAIDCALFLVDSGRTTPDRICAFGRSAGGLLAGGLLTMRPDLFGAVIAEVPFVDVLNTMMDPSLPLTVREYDEWGDPNDAEVWARIRAYAPYENVEARDYPPTLFLAGLADPRVGFWEPAKMLARMRARGRGGPFLLVTKMGEGHRHDAARYAPLAAYAFKYAFAAKAVAGRFAAR